MRKEINYDEYSSMLGKVPSGKVLVMTSTGKYYIADKEYKSIEKPKKKK